MYLWSHNLLYRVRRSGKFLPKTSLHAALKISVAVMPAHATIEHVTEWTLNTDELTPASSEHV